jgi:hypothetical protein
MELRNTRCAMEAGTLAPERAAARENVVNAGRSMAIELARRELGKNGGWMRSWFDCF